MAAAAALRIRVEYDGNPSMIFWLIGSKISLGKGGPFFATLVTSSKASFDIPLATKVKWKFLELYWEKRKFPKCHWERLASPPTIFNKHSYHYLATEIIKGLQIGPKKYELLVLSILRKAKENQKRSKIVTSTISLCSVSPINVTTRQVPLDAEQVLPLGITAPSSRRKRNSEEISEKVPEVNPA
jgi:hypothetical protein